MTSHSTAERALFADLARLMLSMREARYSDVEAMIEERFRRFVRNQAAGATGGEVGGLQITFTWTLPDGVEDLALYATEYKTVPAEQRTLSRRVAVAGADSAVIDFPTTQAHRSASENSLSAQILAFPSR